jgi:MOSC domain-containing protein
VIEVKELYRYPVKGLSAEPLDRLALDRQRGVPYDRSYALALGTTQFSPEAPEPLDKGHFLMLRANESLAALRTGLDPDNDMLTVCRDGRQQVRGDLSTTQGREAIETFFTGYVGEAAKGRVRLVSAPDHKFTDVSVVSPAMMRAVSVINLATVRAMQDVVQSEIHPLRFRANIYLDGLAPWEELSWTGRDVRIGALTLRAVQATRRCAAIDVNPVTAKRDTALPKAIVRHTGHANLGIYLEILESGELHRGDVVAPVA